MSVLPELMSFMQPQAQSLEPKASFFIAIIATAIGHLITGPSSPPQSARRSPTFFSTTAASRPPTPTTCDPVQEDPYILLLSFVTFSILIASVSIFACAKRTFACNSTGLTSSFSPSDSDTDDGDFDLDNDDDAEDFNDANFNSNSPNGDEPDSDSESDSDFQEDCEEDEVADLLFGGAGGDPEDPPPPSSANNGEDDNNGHSQRLGTSTMLSLLNFLIGISVGLLLRVLKARPRTVLAKFEIEPLVNPYSVSPHTGSLLQTVSSHSLFPHYVPPYVSLRIISYSINRRKVYPLLLDAAKPPSPLRHHQRLPSPVRTLRAPIIKRVLKRYLSALCKATALAGNAIDIIIDLIRLAETRYGGHTGFIIGLVILCLIILEVFVFKPPGKTAEQVRVISGDNVALPFAGVELPLQEESHCNDVPFPFDGADLPLENAASSSVVHQVYPSDAFPFQSVALPLEEDQPKFPFADATLPLEDHEEIISVREMHTSQEDIESVSVREANDSHEDDESISVREMDDPQDGDEPASARAREVHESQEDVSLVYSDLVDLPLEDDDPVFPFADVTLPLRLEDVRFICARKADEWEEDLNGEDIQIIPAHVTYADGDAEVPGELPFEEDEDVDFPSVELALPSPEHALVDSIIDITGVLPFEEVDFPLLEADFVSSLVSLVGTTCDRDDALPFHDVDFPLVETEFVTTIQVFDGDQFDIRAPVVDLELACAVNTLVDNFEDESVACLTSVLETGIEEEPEQEQVYTVLALSSDVCVRAFTPYRRFADTFGFEYPQEEIPRPLPARLAYRLLSSTSPEYEYPRTPERSFTLDGPLANTSSPFSLPGPSTPPRTPVTPRKFVLPSPTSSEGSPSPDEEFDDIVRRRQDRKWAKLMEKRRRNEAPLSLPTRMLVEDDDSYDESSDISFSSSVGEQSFVDPHASPLRPSHGSWTKGLQLRGRVPGVEDAGEAGRSAQVLQTKWKPFSPGAKLPIRKVRARHILVGMGENDGWGAVAA
ncbi:hypothetical protein H0H92_006247 [Tricholoma furcatifolium]|nr:hypothetical protein H0H92_006247 [Tricholoma furcatifolium]